ncbi:SDR family oxidoreductase [Catenovulum sp. SX2]|uniref:SDR family oxidoreductase n=1 Tax=Catenovulum sp. SX2 TaxID=3398614 RepID=UPI003F85A3DA
MKSMQSKTIVITGASKGIGKATALHFANKGFNLVVMARNAQALDALVTQVEKNGGQAVAAVGDVSIYPDVERACKLAFEQFGAIDVLVNNAGLIDPISRIADSDVQAWDHIVDVNLKGVYHGMRAAIPLMLAQGGTVINISSGAATSALEGWSHYCSTKAAVLSLTKCAHKEYFAQGINVIGLSPGTVATDMQLAIKNSGINPVSQLAWESHIPPSWVAQAIEFLLSADGKNYAGTDFSLKNNEGRALVGLPAVS